MDNAYTEWLSLAEVDLGVAQHLYDTYYPRPLEIICYHCQQAAEKAIKGVIVAHGSQGGMPKKHDLSFLLSQIKNMSEISDEIYDYADVLTPYGVVVRYPSELFLEERHATEALDYAGKILAWSKNACEDEDT